MLLNSYKSLMVIKNCASAQAQILRKTTLAAAFCILICFMLSGCYPAAEETLKPAKTEPIVLVWEYAGIERELDSIGPMTPVNVVSPTWFHLENAEGEIRSLFDRDYLDWAQSRDYLVWALVTNSFDPEMTATFLASAAYRQSFIDNLMVLAEEHELDGINVDPTFTVSIAY